MSIAASFVPKAIKTISGFAASTFLNRGRAVRVLSPPTPMFTVFAPVAVRRKDSHFPAAVILSPKATIFISDILRTPAAGAASAPNAQSEVPMQNIAEAKTAASLFFITKLPVDRYFSLL